MIKYLSVLPSNYYNIVTYDAAITYFITKNIHLVIPVWVVFFPKKIVKNTYFIKYVLHAIDFDNRVLL